MESNPKEPTTNLCPIRWVSSPYDPRSLPRASESATALPLLQHLTLGRDDHLPHDRSVGIPQFDSEEGHVSLFSQRSILQLTKLPTPR